MADRGLARFTAGKGDARARAPAVVPGRSTPPGTAAPSDAAAPGGPPGVTGPLAQFLRPPAPPTPGESCEMCAQPVPAEHRHAVDLERRNLLCVCQGCSLLFTGDGGEPARYRTVPDRYLRILPFAMPPPAWAALQIPVGMAFVVHVSQLDRPVAFYPSPSGATESELPLDAWSDVVAANPGLDTVEPDVEAVLLRAAAGAGGGDQACFVVPVDRCYALVGVLRLHWRGFDGGQEVRDHIDATFADIAARSRPRVRGVRG